MSWRSGKRDPGSGKNSSLMPGSRGQKSTWIPIRNTAFNDFNYQMLKRAWLICFFVYVKESSSQAAATAAKKSRVGPALQQV
jgi:hypothetical protein